MKRTIKGILTLALAMAMAAGSVISVSAETVKGTVTYSGESVDLAYSTKDIKEKLGSLTPGDDVELEFTLNNDSSDETDWYVEDDVVKAFEDSSKAADGAYNYKLTYTSPAGKETVLYSDEVGGSSADTTVPTGLHQASSGSEKYYYLGRIAPKKSGSVKLAIVIDGESLGNDYQSTLADIGVNFAVEVPDDAENTLVTTKPRTGDSLKLAVYATLFVVTLLMLLFVVIYSRRGRKGGEQ